jgi:hypothetical protein
MDTRLTRPTPTGPFKLTLRWLAAGAAAAIVSASPASAALLRSATRPRSATVSCPRAASVSAAAGRTLGAAKPLSGDGDLVCSYSQQSTGANVVISIADLKKAISVSTFDLVCRSQAESQHASLQSLTGFGHPATLFTAHDASADPDGIATSTLIVLVTSTRELLVTGSLPVAAVRDIGHTVLKQL